MIVIQVVARGKDFFAEYSTSECSSEPGAGMNSRRLT